MANAAVPTSSAPARRPFWRRALALTARWLQFAWSILGLTLLLLVLLELAAAYGFRTLVRTSDSDEIRQFAALADPLHAQQARAVLRDQYYVFLEGYDWTPYIYWNLPSVDTPYTHTDAEGCRQTWNPPAAESRAVPPRRVFMFGGSTLWGAGVRDDETIASHLSRQLAEAGIAAEVTNFGQPGFVSTQEVIQLLRQLQHQHVPDLVVYYDGVNDIKSTLQNRDVGLAGKEQEIAATFRAHRRFDFFPSLAGSLKNLALYNMFHDQAETERTGGRVRMDSFMQAQFDDPAVSQRWQQRVAEAGVKPDSSAAQEIAQQVIIDEIALDTLRAYDTNVATVKGMARGGGFESLLFWQPVSYARAEPAEEEVGGKEGPDFWGPHFKAAYDQFRDLQQAGPEQAEACRHVARDVIDLSGVFDVPQWQGRLAFWDYCHTTGEANAAIAAAMLPHVREKLTPASSAP